MLRLAGHSLSVQRLCHWLIPLVAQEALVLLIVKHGIFVRRDDPGGRGKAREQVARHTRPEAFHVAILGQGLVTKVAPQEALPQDRRWGSRVRVMPRLGMADVALP